MIVGIRWRLGAKCAGDRIVVFAGIDGRGIRRDAEPYGRIARQRDPSRSRDSTAKNSFIPNNRLAGRVARFQMAPAVGADIAVEFRDAPNFTAILKLQVE